MVSDHLHHFDDLFRLAGRYGYLRLPYFVGIVIDDLDGKRSGRHIGYLHPRGRRFGLPRRRIGVHLDGHGPVARSLKRACGIAQPDILRVGPAGCRTPREQSYTRERQSSPDVKSIFHNSSKHLAVIQNRFIKYTVRLVSLSPVCNRRISHRFCKYMSYISVQQQYILSRILLLFSKIRINAHYTDESCTPDAVSRHTAALRDRTCTQPLRPYAAADRNGTPAEKGAA